MTDNITNSPSAKPSQPTFGSFTQTKRFVRISFPPARSLHSAQPNLFPPVNSQNPQTRSQSPFYHFERDFSHFFLVAVSIPASNNSWRIINKRFATPLLFAARYVGSFRVQDGRPAFAQPPQPPPVYTCMEACSLIFGGQSSSYQCSTRGTDPSSIDRMAHISVYFEGCFTAADTFKQSSACQALYCADYDASAYVKDACTDGETNFCFSIGGG